MRRWMTALALFLSLMACQGQTPAEKYLTTPEDEALAVQVMTDLKGYADKPMGDRMVRAAEALLGQPYVAGTLEVPEQETLCIYLTQTDCILFVETCLGLVRAAGQDASFETLARELRESRYRNGVCSRYEDRLHYTTEWARQGVKRCVLQEMTGKLGGVDFGHPVHYMSQHPDSYKRMTDVDAIAAIERQINAVPSSFIPKSALKKALPGIRNGDIILFTTKVDGLDVSHCAIAKVAPGKPVRFIHASTVPMKVVMDPKPLEEYVMGRKAITGIQVYRAVDNLQ